MSCLQSSAQSGWLSDCPAAFAISDEPHSAAAHGVGQERDQSAAPGKAAANTGFDSPL
jgi:hypothetical protein